MQVKITFPYITQFYIKLHTITKMYFAGDLTTYDVAKRFIMRKTNLPDSPTVHILSSICAGFAAAILGTPADVIKTRVMNQPTDEHGRYLLDCRCSCT